MFKNRKPTDLRETICDKSILKKSYKIKGRVKKVAS